MMMPANALSRREWLKAGLKLGAGAASLVALPSPLLADFGRGTLEPVPLMDDPLVRQLAMRAIEAAREAGADYADVRLSHSRMRGVSPNVESIYDAEVMAAGVRVLVNGYWGFVGSPVWSPDEMARLGREATAQARLMATGPSREVDLGRVPIARDGNWVMPIETDAFEVSPFEIVDHLRSLSLLIDGTPHFGVQRNSGQFQVQEKAFASTEGGYCTQRLYRSLGELVFSYRDTIGASVDLLTPAGVGWELYTGQPLREEIRRLMEEMREDHAMPVKPVEVGRYTTVCDARAIATLVDRTLGSATQLDRAMGFEANAGGTSYLADPAEMIGSFEAGSPQLTLTAERSSRGGAATVGWDDEGVAPRDFRLVDGGVLRDFQTTRESASWLAGEYAEAGLEPGSRGCAGAPSAVEVPLTHTPNLAVAPGSEPLDFNGAVAGVENGLAVRGMQLDMDFQGLHGLGVPGRIYEVKDGRRVARIAGAGFLFSAPELWKQLVAVGDESSLRRYGIASSKGEPAQVTYHSVTAPPAVFDELTTIDSTRKA